MKQTVTTTDDSVEIYEARDLNSRVVARVSKDGSIQLGATEVVVEGRLWMEAALEDGRAGYVLGPTVRGHTTFGAPLPLIASPPNLGATVAERVKPEQREREAKNAGLWNCSICGSPAAVKVIASRRFFYGEVCNGCGRVLCGECVRSRTSHICQCGGLFVLTPFDLRKKPLDQTVVDARAAGETPSSLLVARGFLFLGILAVLLFIAVNALFSTPSTTVLRYAIITIGIILATVGLTRKKGGLLFLGAAIIAAGQLFFK